MGFERDQNCEAENFPSLGKTFARELLNKDSYLTGLKEVSRAETILVKPLDGIAARKRANVWTVPKTFAPGQKFLRHILHSLSMYHKEEGLLKDAIIFQGLSAVRSGVDV